MPALYPSRSSLRPDLTAPSFRAVAAFFVGDLCRFCSSPFRSPPLLLRRNDSLHSLRANLAFCLRCRGWRCRFRFALDSGPSCLLSQRHPFLGGRRGSFALLWTGLRCDGGWFSGATGQHGTEFGDLCVDLRLFVFKSEDCCFDNCCISSRNRRATVVVLSFQRARSPSRNNGAQSHPSSARSPQQSTGGHVRDV